MTEEFYETLKQWVARGIRLLDEKRPGWVKEIDLPTLDIGDCDYCVLGQLYGHYDTGESKLNVNSPWTFGFNITLMDDVNNPGAWRALQKIWVEEISKLKAAQYV